MHINDSNQAKRFIAFLAAVCCAVQLVLVPHIALGNGRANLMLVLAACVALRSGGKTGVTVGFLAGLFFDLTTTGPIGLMAFELTIASYVIGRECRNRFAEEQFACVLPFAIADGAVCLGYNLTMLLVGEQVSLFGIVFLRALPTFVLTFLAFLPFLYVLGSRSSSVSFGGRHSSLGRGGRHVGPPRL